MKWIKKGGKEINVPIHKYYIDWDRKAPSKGSQKTKDFLKIHCAHDILLEEFKLPSSLLRADFLNLSKRFVIEFDGKNVHDSYNKFFHKNKVGYLNSIKRDVKKEEEFERNGFKVIRITDEELPLLSVKWFEDEHEVFL